MLSRIASLENCDTFTGIYLLLVVCVYYASIM